MLWHQFFTERNLSLVYDTKGDNQIASDRNGYSWAYDGDGNPTTYLSYANTFDPEDRMTGYGIPVGGGHARLAMGYDGDGRRAWKEPTNLARIYFLYDGSDLVAELNSTGALQTYQTVGADGLISRRTGSTSTFYTFDPAGNLAVVLNGSSAVLGDELFEANGRRDGSYSARPVDFGGQWGYYGDAETGLTLLGHRYYDAYAGRFLTRDPIGYSGGVNLYSYTANDYENERDPDGYSRDLRSPPTKGPDGLPFPPGTRFHPDPNNRAHDPHWDIDIPQNTRSGMDRIKDGSTEWRYYPLRNRARGHWQEKAGSKNRRANRQLRPMQPMTSCPLGSNDVIYPDGKATAIAVGGIASIYLLPEEGVAIIGGAIARSGAQVLSDVLIGAENAFGNGLLSGPLTSPTMVPLSP